MYSFLELVCGRKNGRCPDIVEKFEESCTYEHQCYSDLNCEGSFKCCEDDCGISRCVRPETDAVVITTGKGKIQRGLGGQSA